MRAHGFMFYNCFEELRCAYECLWCYAHEWSWMLMAAHECLWAFLKSQKCSQTLMSNHEQSWAWPHEHSWALMSIQEGSWALRSMLPWQHKRSRALRSTNDAMAQYFLVILRAPECYCLFSNKWEIFIFKITSFVNISVISWSKFHQIMKNWIVLKSTQNVLFRNV